MTKNEKASFEALREDRNRLARRVDELEVMAREGNRRVKRMQDRIDLLHKFLRCARVKDFDGMMSIAAEELLVGAGLPYES